MKRISIIFIQIVIVLIGIATLVLLLWEPHLEGRNAHATLQQIYFNDPFLACAYIVSIAFFVALYQAYMLLGYIRQNNLFSLGTVRALRTIKYCMIVLIGSLIVAEVYLFVAVRGQDDIAGGMAIGHFLILVFTMIGVTAAVFERHARRAVEAKRSNDSM